MDGVWFSDVLGLLLLSLHLLHLEFGFAISVILCEIAILAESFRIMQFVSVLTQPCLFLLLPLLCDCLLLVEAAYAITVCMVSPVFVSTLICLVFEAILQFKDDLRVWQVAEFLIRLGINSLFIIFISGRICSANGRSIFRFPLFSGGLLAAAPATRRRVL